MTWVRRRFALLSLGIVAVLALCACNAGSQIVVQPDGSGTFSTVLTVEGTAGDALYQSVQKAESSSTVPLTVTRYTSGAESGAKISAPFRSLNDLTAIGKNLGSSAGLAGVAVAKAKSGWTFVAHSTDGLVRPSGAATGSTGGVIDGAQLAGVVHMSVSVALPGAPGKTNADTVTHTATTTTFVWKLAAGRTAEDLAAATTFVGNQKSVALSTALTSLKSSAAAGATPAAGPVSAAAASGSGHGMIAGAGIGVAVLIIAGAIILLLVRSRRSRLSGQ